MASFEELFNAVKQAQNRGGGVREATTGFAEQLQTGATNRQAALKAKLEQLTLDSNNAFKAKDDIRGDANLNLEIEKAKRKTALVDPQANKLEVFPGISEKIAYDPAVGLTGLEGAKPAETPKVTGSGGKTTTKAMADIDALNEVTIALNDLSANYDPAFVGAVDKRVTGAKQYSGVGASDKASNFRTGVNSLRNTILKARSGGAVTPQEADRLLMELPDDSFSDPDFQARSRKTIEKFKMLLDSKRKFLGSAVPDRVLFEINEFPASAAPAQTPPPAAAAGTPAPTAGQPVAVYKRNAQGKLERVK